jgi:uncharacterized phage protein (TIGR01671 family)
MREILFRGKRKDNGEWVYGALYSYYDFKRTIVQILTDRTNGIPDAYEVIPETVGQFIDITDKNGKKVFEGDIVKGIFYGFPLPIENFVLTIGWQEDIAGYGANYFENVEVIGNIHDNPELLKEGANND